MKTSDGYAAEIESAIFETAMGIENLENRIQFLRATFNGDPVGYQRMVELLEISGESAAFFIEGRRQRADLADEIISHIPEEDEEIPDVPDQEIGTVIDRYRLIQRIGEGGWGVVYEAEQQPVRRRVALKVIRRGMDTESAVSRFSVERQALELMDHPYIARVIDAGATQEGRPYFVMELVRGKRITTYCDEEKLDVRARLKLFINVCHAIQHAHQKGIIHRDIKPSNVLIASQDGMMVPKVIDFGIAKAADRGLSRRELSTALDQLVGTPAYMSPEQVDMGGIDIDTRSDIYSLGALLYELLAGCPPFDSTLLMKAGMLDMRQTLLEKDPPLPSNNIPAGEMGNAIAAARCTEYSRLLTVLRGDLDWIVAKAMEKDRNRRYQTVNSLAMEVRRFLANEPVTARRPSRIYLMNKFFRRNKVSCISAAAVILSLFGGLGAATTLYLRERDAVSEQVRLGHEAEAARAEESRLKQQAQARANLSRAAVLLSEGKVEEADALVRENPLQFIEPSREAADVFRSLGTWNAAYGRWQQAVACFNLLHQANRLDNPSSIAEGSDLLMIAPVYLEMGDVAGYEKFRKEAIEFCSSVETSLGAEHLLKIGLLTPGNDKLMEALEPMARICETGGKPSRFTSFREWETFSLGLYYYRKNQPIQALRWLEESEKRPDRSGTRVTAIGFIRSMALKELGRLDEAQKQWEIASSMMPPLPHVVEGGQPAAGLWFSWSISRALMRESSKKVF